MEPPTPSVLPPNLDLTPNTVPTTIKLPGPAITTILRRRWSSVRRVAGLGANQHGLRLECFYPAELNRRCEYSRSSLTQQVQADLDVIVPNSNDNLDCDHISGACRSGDNGSDSVEGRFNRAHDLENPYVVDASVFQLSGGTNSSLMIAANVLREVEQIERKLGKVISFSCIDWQSLVLRSIEQAGTYSSSRTIRYQTRLFPVPSTNIANSIQILSSTNA